MFSCCVLPPQHHRTTALDLVRVQGPRSNIRPRTNERTTNELMTFLLLESQKWLKWLPLLSLIMTSSPVPHSPRPTHFDHLQSRSPLYMGVQSFQATPYIRTAPRGRGVGNCIQFTPDFRTFASAELARSLSSLTCRWALSPPRVYSALASGGHIAADDLIWGEHVVSQLSLSGPSRRMNHDTCHEEPHRTRCPLTHFIE
ncbi:hypothetical protein BJY52DRAFT_273923 [Lactarius psammicola]|nr:hypothetical protein BJY52DRAFT_273923 [Lactarius psammicola]